MFKTMSSRKDVSTRVFGKTRRIASVPKPLVTDLLTVVEAYSKQRAPRLDKDRLNALDVALAEGHQGSKTSNSSSDDSKENCILSLEALQLAVAAWREEAALVEFDADTHYDGTHVKSYHAKFKVPQERHTRRCLYLLDKAALDHESGNSTSELLPPEDSSLYGRNSSSCDVALDIGCGSGLSSRVLEPFFKFVVGIDASAAMLRRADADKHFEEDEEDKRNREVVGKAQLGEVVDAEITPSTAFAGTRPCHAASQTDIAETTGTHHNTTKKKTGLMVDYVQCNFGHRLPFRANSFACSTSTSAVHYLIEHPVRMNTLVTELERCCVGDSAWQLFPNRGLEDLLQLKAIIEKPSAPAASHMGSELFHENPGAQNSSVGAELGPAIDAAPIPEKYKHFGIYGDRPHRGSNAAPRWYVHLSRAPQEQRLCPACEPLLLLETSKSPTQSALCLDRPHGASLAELAAKSAAVAADGVKTAECPLFAPASCLLCAVRKVAYEGKTLEDEHWRWLEAEHGRFLKREARLRRREALLASNSTESS